MASPPWPISSWVALDFFLPQPSTALPVMCGHMDSFTPTSASSFLGKVRPPTQRVNSLAWGHDSEGKLPSLESEGGPVQLSLVIAVSGITVVTT
jgi:hypothetical protein